MKKIALLLFMVFALAACGSYKAKVTTNVTPTFNIWSDGSAATTYNYFDVAPVNNTLKTNTIQSLGWNIDGNTGGSGSIGLAFTASGGNCSTVTPLESIPVTAGQVSTADAAFQPATVTALNNVLNGMGAYRVCISVTNANTASPVNVHLRIPTVASETVGG